MKKLSKSVILAVMLSFQITSNLFTSDVLSNLDDDDVLEDPKFKVPMPRNPTPTLRIPRNYFVL